jgi:hypothetical protein
MERAALAARRKTPTLADAMRKVKYPVIQSPLSWRSKALSLRVKANFAKHLDQFKFKLTSITSANTFGAEGRRSRCKFAAGTIYEHNSPWIESAPWHLCLADSLQ